MFHTQIHTSTYIYWHTNHQAPYLMPFVPASPRAALTAPRRGRLSARLEAEAVRLGLGVVLTALLLLLPFCMGRLLLLMLLLLIGLPLLVLLQQSRLLDAAVGEAASDEPLLLHL